MDSNDLTDYFKRHQYDLTVTKKSRDWFRQQTLLLRKENINRTSLFQRSGQLASKVVVGNLYMFFYDPKYKEELPFYDRFPLVFPFDKTKDGFIGLNMHYLTPYLRFRLFDQLLKFKNSKTLNDKTKLRYSYQMIKGLSTFPFGKNCVKQYLRDHLMTPLKLVPATDWASALMMPTENFAKASVSTVWNQTTGQTMNPWQKSGGL